MAIALVVLYAGLACAVGWLWRRKGLGFAAGTLWSILLSPVIGAVLGVLQKPRSSDADGGSGPRRPPRWLVPGTLLLAIFLLALAAAVTVEEGPSPRGRIARARTDVRRIASDGVEAFHATSGRYPTTQEGLSLLIEKGFLRYNAPDRTLRDPWNHPYVYERPGRLHPDAFDVCTYGADGQPGGEGESADICNE